MNMKWMFVGTIIAISIPTLYVQAGGMSMGMGGGLREILDENSAFGSEALGATVRGDSFYVQTSPGKDDMICIPVPKPKPKPSPDEGE